MITLSLLQYLADNNFGTVDQDLFWQKLSLGKTGVYLVDLGQAQDRKGRRQQRYELYSRGTSDVDGYEKLTAIINFLNNNFGTICTLPSCPLVPSSESYSNVTIMPLSTPTNIGEDTNGRIIWSTSGVINY